MKATDIIGWTYDASAHCEECAAQRFSSAQLRNPATEDTEGNPVRPIFASDDTKPEGEYCDDCGACIADPADTADIVDVLREWSLESGQDDECGSATEGAGWYALFLNVTAEELTNAGMFNTAITARDLGPLSYILYCDTQGFYDAEEFEQAEDAQAQFDTLREESMTDD